MIHNKYQVKYQALRRVQAKILFFIMLFQTLSITASQCTPLPQDQEIIQKLDLLIDLLSCSCQDRDPKDETRAVPCFSCNGGTLTVQDLDVTGIAEFFNDVIVEDNLTVLGQLIAPGFALTSTLESLTVTEDATIGCDLTVGCNINLNDSLSAATGNIYKAGTPFIHNYGVANTFVGKDAGNFSISVTGVDNSGFGAGTLSNNISGNDNTALGFQALLNNQADDNTAVGSGALQTNTTGTGNTAVGYQAMVNNATGSDNIAIGNGAGNLLVTGSGNIYIDNAGADENGTIRIGTDQSATYIAGITGVTVANPLVVVIDPSGQLGSTNNPGGNGSNTSIGEFALQSNVSGVDNTAIGFSALENNLASQNTAIGAGTLQNNTTGQSNTALGYDALQNNTIGSGNVALGQFALQSNTTGLLNVAVGEQAMQNAITSEDVAVGYQALQSDVGSGGNTAVGTGSLSACTTGAFNIAVGRNAGAALITGSNNIYLGNSGSAADSGMLRFGTNGTHTGCVIQGIYGVNVPSGAQVVIGANGQLGEPFVNYTFTSNVYIAQGSTLFVSEIDPLSPTTTTSFSGSISLPNATTANNGSLQINGIPFLHNFGTNNTFVGASTGNLVMSGGGNTALGASAMKSNTTGASNTAIGQGALQANTTGGSNIALGVGAGNALTTGSNNINIGSDAFAQGVAGDKGTIRIGFSHTLSTSTFIAGIYGRRSASGVNVLVNSNGQLATASSSQIYKQDIASIQSAQQLMQLRPVTFRYKPQYADSPDLQYGLIAEEVNAVIPDLVITDATGWPDLVRYHFLAPLLLKGYQDHQNRLDAIDTVLTATLGGGIIEYQRLQKQCQDQAKEVQELGKLYKKQADDYRKLRKLFEEQSALLDQISGQFKDSLLTRAAPCFSCNGGTLDVDGLDVDGQAEFFNDVIMNSSLTVNGQLIAPNFSANPVLESLTVTGTAGIGCDLTVGCNINLDDSLSATAGNIYKAGSSFIHNYGSNNTFVGKDSGNFSISVTGIDNSGFGVGTLASNITGSNNTAVGFQALSNNQADENTAVGSGGLQANLTGTSNTAIGYQAMINNTTGADNIVLGSGAGNFLVTGSGNIYIDNAGANENGIIRIGTDQSATYIAGINGATVTSPSIVGIDSSGQFGIVPSIGYSGNNTFIGVNALDDNIAGVDNTAIGFNALENNLASQNTAAGSGALQSATTALSNTALGFDALQNTTTGSDNVALGQFALQTSTTGFLNVAVGYQAMQNALTSRDVALGAQALQRDVGPGSNTAVGAGSLFAYTTGASNIAVGQSSGASLITGSNNIYYGNSGSATDSGMLRFGTNTTHTGCVVQGIAGVTVPNGLLVVVGPSGQLGTGGLPATSQNYTFGSSVDIAQGTTLFGSEIDPRSPTTTTSFSGSISLPNSTTTNNGSLQINGIPFLNNFGTNNTFVGASAGNLVMSGGGNTALGASAMQSNTTGASNTAIGQGALQANTTGGSNIALGVGAGNALTTGSNNINIGSDAFAQGVAGDTGTIRIGFSHTLTTSTFIAGIYGRQSASGVPVLVNSNGQLGTASSSQRYKQDIASIQSVDQLMQLRPVTFCYKPSYADSPDLQYGLIAQEVHAIAPDLVLTDTTAQPDFVRYHFLEPLLVKGYQDHNARLDAIDTLFSTSKLQELCDGNAKEVDRIYAQCQDHGAQYDELCTFLAEHRKRLDAINKGVCI